MPQEPTPRSARTPSRRRPAKQACVEVGLAGEAFSRALGLEEATREDLYPHHLVGRGRPCCEGPRTLGGRNLFRAADPDNPAMSRRKKNCRNVGAWRILPGGCDEPFESRAFAIELLRYTGPSTSPPRELGLRTSLRARVSQPDRSRRPGAALTYSSGSVRFSESCVPVSEGGVSVVFQRQRGRCSATFTAATPISSAATPSATLRVAPWDLSAGHPPGARRSSRSAGAARSLFERSPCG
jgi:hypothetical protein